MNPFPTQADRRFYVVCVIINPQSNKLERKIGPKAHKANTYFKRKGQALLERFQRQLGMLTDCGRYTHMCIHVTRRKFGPIVRNKHTFDKKLIYIDRQTDRVIFIYPLELCSLGGGGGKMTKLTHQVPRQMTRLTNQFPSLMTGLIHLIPRLMTGHTHQFPRLMTRLIHLVPRQRTRLTRPVPKQMTRFNHQVFRQMTKLTHHVPEKVRCFGRVQETDHFLCQSLLYSKRDNGFPGPHKGVDKQKDSVTLNILIWLTQSIYHSLKNWLYKMKLL